MYFFHACMKQTVTRRCLLVRQQQQQQQQQRPLLQQLEQHQQRLQLLLGTRRQCHFLSQQQQQQTLRFYYYSHRPHQPQQKQQQLMDDSSPIIIRLGGGGYNNRHYYSSLSSSTTLLGTDAALLDTSKDAEKRTTTAASIRYHSSSSSSGASLWWNKRETTTSSNPTSFTRRWEDEAWLQRARDIWESNDAATTTTTTTDSYMLTHDDDDDDEKVIEALLSRINEASSSYQQPLLCCTEKVDLLQRLCRQRPLATTASGTTTDFMNQTLEGILFRPIAVAAAARHHHQQQQAAATTPKVLTLEYLRQTIEETCWKQQPGCWQPNHDTFRLYIRIATDVFHDAQAAQEILHRQWQYYYRALSDNSSSSNNDADHDDNDNKNNTRRWLHLIRPNRYTYTCVIQAWSRQAASATANNINKKTRQHENHHLVPHQEIEKLIRELQDYYLQDCSIVTTRTDTTTTSIATPSSSSSSSSFKPTEAAYIGWIKALSSIDDNDKHADMVMRKVLDILKELVQNAQRDDFWPSTAIYNAVLFRILHSNNNNSHQKNSGTSNSSNYHYDGTIRQRPVALNRVQTAETLVGEMCQSYMNGMNRYCMPDTTTFSTIMSAWNKTTTTTTAPPPLSLEQNGSNDQHHHVVDNDEFAPEIRAERLLNLLIDLYRQTGHASLRPNEYVWSCVINAWAKSSAPRAPQRAEELLYRMIDMHHEHAQLQQEQQQQDIDPLPLPNTVIFNSVLNAWARSSAVDAPERLEAIWRRMVVVDTDKNDNDKQQQQQQRRIQIRPNALSYMARISVWERSHRPHNEMITKCREILNEMLLYDANHNHCLSNKQQGSDISMVKHYNRVLLTMARAGRTDEAEELVREMQSADGKPNKIVIQPNLTTYNFLLLAWSKSKSPHAPFGAEAVLQEMMMQQKQQKQQRQTTRITVQPDHVSLNTALACWDRSNHPQAPERAWRLYTILKNKCRVKPDKFSFGFMLQAVVHSKAHTPDQKATMALQLQQEMAKEGIKADSYVRMLVGKCFKGTTAKHSSSGSSPPMDEVVV